MKCSKCGSLAYERANGIPPVDRQGVLFRLKVCMNCGASFMTAELVVNGEFEPVALLDSVLKQAMDESDARAQAEIEAAESIEELAEEEYADEAL